MQCVARKIICMLVDCNILLYAAMHMHLSSGIYTNVYSFGSKFQDKNQYITLILSLYFLHHRFVNVLSQSIWSNTDKSRIDNK